MVNKTPSKEYLDQRSMEEQEHLTLQRLSSTTVEMLIGKAPLTPRPPANFNELMDWVVENFSNQLKTETHLNKLVHNRILIDGQFLQFCEENNVKVKCLYKESIISWKSEFDYEKFFVQGVFLIQYKDIEFLHAALFHKGNQNEDEVSFFVIVSEKHHDKYIQLRNDFDEWILERDRSNLNIRVINGSDIPYTKDCSWNDLFLPEDIKTELKELVENFLDSKEFYLNNRIPWKRGILLFGPPGNGKTSIIKTIISEYNFKPVTFINDNNPITLRETFAYAEEQSPSLLYIEDLDSLIESGMDSSIFLNLMDGISAKNGILVVATANNVSKLKANITRRPSRFDRKFEIPLPDQKLAYIYLKKWFGNIITPAKCKEIAKTTVDNNLSYAYLKDLYVSSMFEALSKNKKIPTIKDIENTLNRLIKDYNLLNNDNAVNMEKYFR